MSTEKKKLINIDNRTWTPEDVHYWINPEDGTVNAVIMFDGKKTRLRAGILIINNKGEILLTHEGGDADGELSLPGGGLEIDETPKAAGEREAQEEVHMDTKNLIDTGFDYCEVCEEVKPWVKKHVPEEEWWYNYYTCLILGRYDGEYEGKVAKVDEDPHVLKSAKWRKLEDVIHNPTFKEQWKKAILKYVPELAEGLKITIQESLDELYTPPKKEFKVISPGQYLYHWTDKDFRGILKPNWQGIHCATSIPLCRELAKVREKATGVNFYKGHLYRIRLTNTIPLNPLCFDIDTLGWGGREVAQLILKRCHGEAVAGAVAHPEYEHKPDEYNDLYTDDVDNAVVQLPQSFIDSLTQEDLKTLQELENTKTNTSSPALFIKLKRLLMSKGINCIIYSDYGEDMAGGDCYVLFDDYLIVEQVELSTGSGEPLGYGGNNVYKKPGYKESLQLTEDTRNQLVAKSRTAGPYKDQSRGKNRFERKKFSRIATQVKSYNQIDMDQFFKQDILEVTIPVKGETADYNVVIKLNGVLEEIRRNIKANKNAFEYRTVLQALTKIFNMSDVYVKCSCLDFRFQFDHWSIVHQYSANDSTSDPGPGKGIANPHDDKGIGCKHILLALANAGWIMHVASVINNYVHYAENNMQKAFLAIIFPKLYDIPASAAVEQGLVPEDTKIETTKDIIDVINKYGKERGKIKPGTNTNPVTGTGPNTKFPQKTKPEEKKPEEQKPAEKKPAEKKPADKAKEEPADDTAKKPS